MPPTRSSYASSPLPQTAFLILVSLAEQPCHGYGLRKDLLERSKGEIDLDPGSLYRLIYKLGEDGLIESLAPADTGPDEMRRRVYQLTRTGRAVLKTETTRMAALVEQAHAAGARRKRHA